MNTRTVLRSSLLFGALLGIALFFAQPSFANEGCELIDDTGVMLSTTDGGIIMEFGQTFKAGDVYEMHNFFRNPAFKGKAIIDDSRLSFAITPVR